MQASKLAAEYVAAWLEIRGVIAAKMRADMRPALAPAEDAAEYFGPVPTGVPGGAQWVRFKFGGTIEPGSYVFSGARPDPARPRDFDEGGES